MNQLSPLSLDYMFKFAAVHQTQLFARLLVYGALNAGFRHAYGCQFRTQEPTNLVFSCPYPSPKINVFYTQIFQAAVFSSITRMAKMQLQLSWQSLIMIIVQCEGEKQTSVLFFFPFPAVLSFQLTSIHSIHKCLDKINWFRV